MLRIIATIFSDRLSNLSIQLMSSARQLGVEAFVKVMLPMAYIFVLVLVLQIAIWCNCGLKTMALRQSHVTAMQKLGD